MLIFIAGHPHSEDKSSTIFYPYPYSPFGIVLCTKLLKYQEENLLFKWQDFRGSYL